MRSLWFRLLNAFKQRVVPIPLVRAHEINNMWYGLGLTINNASVDSHLGVGETPVRRRCAVVLDELGGRPYVLYLNRHALYAIVDQGSVVNPGIGRHTSECHNRATSLACTLVRDAL